MFQDKFGKILGIALILLLSFNFFYLMYISQTMNEKNKQIEQKIVELNKKIDSLQDENKRVEIINSNEIVDVLQQ